MVKARKYVVVKKFQGKPKKDDFEIVEEELPPVSDGEILVKTLWISVDPYIRAHPSFLGFQVPYDQESYQVAVVLESKNSEFPVGSHLISQKGWRDYTVINPNEKFMGLGLMMYKLPDIKDLSLSLAVGTLGMPGVTAYYGFLDICKPKPGEIVAITGAAGAVGSTVGQIAKIKGCKVIAFTGSDDKVQWLEKELGFDKAFNYKKVDANKVLREVAPNGIDCFFDNVGGELSSVIINNMNQFGRVSICGSVSVYNDDVCQLPKATILQPAIVFRQLRVEGFQIIRWNQEQWLEAIKKLANWIKEGKMKAKDHVTEGFDKVADAFIGMLAGENFGKAVVKV